MAKRNELHQLVRGKSPEERFEIYVERSDGCWRWRGNITVWGYGLLTFDNKPMLAHRLSYLLHRGEIPRGLCVLHKCDNRSCTNPDHLFLGTRAENVTDMDAKGRRQTITRMIPGMGHPRAKLNDEDVRSIRLSQESDTAMAQKLGVSRATIHAARRGKTWRHIH